SVRRSMGERLRQRLELGGEEARRGRDDGRVFVVPIVLLASSFKPSELQPDGDAATRANVARANASSSAAMNGAAASRNDAISSRVAPQLSAPRTWPESWL